MHGQECMLEPWGAGTLKQDTRSKVCTWGHNSPVVSVLAGMEQQALQQLQGPQEPAAARAEQ